MGNEFKGLASHSAEWFGDTRDHWWNADWLALMGARSGASAARDVLDVGCGVGHWGRTLGTILPPDVRLTGVDREARWVEAATTKASERGLGERFRYQVGTADALDFPDASFDLVTCQTVLIHVRDAAAVVKEMTRVTRPGGVVLLAEPNNGVWPVVELAGTGAQPHEIADVLRFHLLCLRGKIALGEGDELVGEAMPALLSGAGLERVEIRMNDRTAPMLPPYATPAEQANAEEILDLADREHCMWGREETRRRFVAGGGADAAFDALWTTTMAQRRRVADAIKERRFAAAGGGLFYVGWGSKPASEAA